MVHHFKYGFDQMHGIFSVKALNNTTDLLGGVPPINWLGIFQPSRLKKIFLVNLSKTELQTFLVVLLDFLKPRIQEFSRLLNNIKEFDAEYRISVEYKCVIFYVTVLKYGLILVKVHFELNLG